MRENSINTVKLFEVGEVWKVWCSKREILKGTNQGSTLLFLIVGGPFKGSEIIAKFQVCMCGDGQSKIY